MTNALSKTMSGIATLGHGGLEMLTWRDDLRDIPAAQDALGTNARVGKILLRVPQ